jgi:hypothetical protein
MTSVLPGAPAAAPLARVTGQTVGSGSYAPEDVTLLMRPMTLAPTDVAEKERLIQSGERHYSEMISEEAAPTRVHQSLYTKVLQQNARRMAEEVQSLALGIEAHFTGPTIALVSFARAGLPLGVLLYRALENMGHRVRHYGISIIRDKGIDRVALDAIIAAHGAENLVFVDGWTGKGAISDELQRSLADDPRFPGEPPFVVLADPCGKAWMAASSDDWIIPSGILGGTVSGLVSRSILPQDGGLHGCVVYDHLREHDVTRDFIEVVDLQRVLLNRWVPARPWTRRQREQLQQSALSVVDSMARDLGITNLNRIKPGIAEATRAVLRRVPDSVFVRDREDPDVRLLMHLTERQGVPVEEVGERIGPYRALTVIRRAS